MRELLLNIEFAKPPRLFLNLNLIRIVRIYFQVTCFFLCPFLKSATFIKYNF